MKLILYLSIFSLLAFTTYGQELSKAKEGQEFKSVFQKLKNGEFNGTVNGVLFIKNLDNQEVILDFQASPATLSIQAEKEEVYDVSTKIYSGSTSSGKTRIEYKTYAGANSIGIQLSNQIFELSLIDGACDMVINGIEYYYQAEATAEYLVLNFSKEVSLSNWQYLLKTEHTRFPDNVDQLKRKEKEIRILPHSTLIFVIKRK